MKNTFIIAAITFTSIGSVAQNLSFTPAVPAPLFQDADVGSIELADVDNDGDNDFLATGKGGPVLTTLYKNDGMGNFTKVLNAPFVNVFGGAVAFADVDNDSDFDLLITGNTQGGARSAELYSNDGSGNYAIVSGNSFEPNWGGDLAFADIDNDGDQDVIITGINAQDNALTKLYANNGSGVFSEVTGTPFEQVGASTVEFFDSDGDGDQDVLLAGENDNGVSLTTLYANNGSGSFMEIANTPFSNMSGGDFAIADTDNDGDADILISGSMSTSELYSNNGMGMFSLVSGTPFPGASSGETDFEDFDNDGDVDVIITGVGSGGIISNIYENLGSNNFIPSDTLAGAYLSSTALGDINGDNAADVIIAGTSFTAPVRSTKTYLNVTANIGLQEIDELTSVSVFPNPSKGEFKIDLNQSQAPVLKIYNANGILIYSDSDFDCKNSIQLTEPGGLYLLVIQTKDETKVTKLLLQE